MPIRAELIFAEKTTQKPFYLIQPHGQPAVREGRFASHAVDIHDARALNAPPSLDRMGFQLLSGTDTLPATLSDAEAPATAYDATCRLLRDATGAQDVHIFDHTIRSSAPDSTSRGTAAHAHNDYTPASLIQKMADIGLSPGPRRVMQVNAWRPLSEPVRVSPLALADGSTVPRDDLVACDLVYPDRMGEIFELSYSPGHRWYYFPEMRRSETLLIKGYDSLEDGPVRFTPHSAFAHPDEHPGLPPRKSIEFRAVLIFPAERGTT